MERIRGCFRGMDADQVFDYKTVKMVRIKDRRLGLLYYFFVLCIVIYIVVGEVLLLKKYMLLEKPEGSVRLSLLEPKTYNRNVSYCSPDSTIVPKLSCFFWDAQDVVYPTIEQTAMFVTTRVVISSQDLICPDGQASCAWQTNSTSAYYSGDIESFTLMIDHTMFGFLTGYQENARGLTGKLLDEDGKEIKNLPSPNQFEKGKTDILQLKVLLDAVKINLDSLSDLGTNESYRYSGLVLLLFLNYDNTGSFDPNDIIYRIEVRRVKQTEFKVVESIFDLSNDVVRVLRNRHGIRFLFVQTGTLGKFDFQTLLLTLVSGLGLLAAATLLVDFLMVCVLPERDFYSLYKFESTVDFSDFRAGRTAITPKGGASEPGRNGVELQPVSNVTV
eukprot:TRINITY_DN2584_c0_g1_i1.p1 TRINITY_DN2584_c0_g1~~TRINITY_DN2584_c0_g1_i1.p1  ORF type:complete len:407 (-),score=79.82 TRINITY_DN2584_c0_g1_i1:184-1347(-)